jgi:hypothetical protein
VGGRPEEVGYVWSLPKGKEVDVVVGCEVGSTLCAKRERERHDDCGELEMDTFDPAGVGGSAWIRRYF